MYMYEWYAREPVVYMCTSGMLMNRWSARVQVVRVQVVCPCTG